MICRYVYVVLVLIVVIATYIMAYNIGLGVAVDEQWLRKKSDYQTVINEYRIASKKLPELKDEIASASDLIAELNNFKSDKENYQSEIDDLKNEISELTSNKSTLESDISALTSEKAELTKDISEAKGKGYSLTAGNYVGGEDIPTGTYNINLQRGSGNLAVRSSTGSLLVNEIFGSKSAYGQIKTYNNCYVGYGTTIEISGSVKVQFKAKE